MFYLIIGPYQGHLDGYTFETQGQTSHPYSGQITRSSINTNQSLRMNSAAINTNQPSQRQTVQLISLSPTDEREMVWPNPSSNATYFMDLEGIDFSAASDETSDMKPSSSSEDVTAAPSRSIYPDIRSAFR